MVNEGLTLRNVREANRKNIICSILDRGYDMRRDELASENGISIMTVKKIVSEFLAFGIVEEQEVPSGVGRRPKVLRMAEQYGTIACVSLTSREYFSYQIMDFKRNILEKRQLILKEQYSYHENLLQLQESLRQDLERTGLTCVGICLSVPSAYYEEQDLVNYDLIPEFKDLHLKQLFREAFGLENVSVVHDVFAAAQAEYNRLEGFKGSLFYFYVGYGVGGACVNGGNWQSGHDLVAGEIGQMIVEAGGEERTLESVISIPAILDDIYDQCGERISFYEALLRYKDGDACVTERIGRATGQIAKALYAVSWIINPAYIVIGGVYPEFVKILVEACRRYNTRMTRLSIRNSVQIRAAVSSDGEMDGCYDIVMERWIDWVVHSIPETE